MQGLSDALLSNHLGYYEGVGQHPLLQRQLGHLFVNRCVGTSAAGKMYTT